MTATGLVHHTQELDGWRLVMIRGSSLWVSGREIAAGLSMTIVGIETKIETSVKTTPMEDTIGTVSPQSP